ncbi:MAG: hypothetical protein A3E38_01845 [Candidatus Moranbacteria bacterium RIFCSPHIGHO2_12_FULL_54_9]|nr:MAG: hypothetical protein A3E38_01845 [Candidatus Moranbacteria bacterium RIFCSPHIGHO2_12_FULL_54_9]
MGRIFGLLAVIVVAGGLFLFFGNDKQTAEAPADVPNTSPTAAEKPAPTTPSPSSTPSESAITKDITVKASNWQFEPNEIRVKEGTQVKITLQGVSGKHAFAIPELRVKSAEVSAGETTTVEFVASKKGTFPFKCSVFCGEGHSGMTGALIVE